MSVLDLKSHLLTGINNNNALHYEIHLGSLKHQAYC